MLASLENVQLMRWSIFRAWKHRCIYISDGCISRYDSQIATSFATGGLGLWRQAGIAKAMTGRAIGGFIGSMIRWWSRSRLTLEATDAGFSKKR